MLTRFFARRYLFSPKSRSVINVIAGVSVLSFAMPVAAMIVLLSVLNGFGDFAKSMSSAFDADLTVAPREGQTFASAEIDSLALTRVKGVGVVSYKNPGILMTEIPDSEKCSRKKCDHNIKHNVAACHFITDMRRRRYVIFLVHFTSTSLISSFYSPMLSYALNQLPVSADVSPDRHNCRNHIPHIPIHSMQQKMPHLFSLKSLQVWME